MHLSEIFVSNAHTLGQIDNQPNLSGILVAIRDT